MVMVSDLNKNIGGSTELLKKGTDRRIWAYPYSPSSKSYLYWTFLCQVTDVDSFWVWTKRELIAGLYHVSWYNSQSFNYKEGFVSNREAFLIGLPRLRQIRLKQGEN